jgi:hypothetical protein
MTLRPSYGSIRPYTVAEDLADLAGPEHGVVVLPLRMDWSQQRRYDLEADGDRRLLYETVLNEALHPNDLYELLSGELLVLLWPMLWLPARVRDLWEARFPQLAVRRAA